MLLQTSWKKCRDSKRRKACISRSYSNIRTANLLPARNYTFQGLMFYRRLPQAIRRQLMRRLMKLQPVFPTILIFRGIFTALRINMKSSREMKKPGIFISKSCSNVLIARFQQVRDCIFRGSMYCRRLSRAMKLMLRPRLTASNPSFKATLIFRGTFTASLINMKN